MSYYDELPDPPKDDPYWGFVGDTEIAEKFLNSIIKIINEDDDSAHAEHIMNSAADYDDVCTGYLEELIIELKLVSDKYTTIIGKILEEHAAIADQLFEQ